MTPEEQITKKGRATPDSRIDGRTAFKAGLWYTICNFLIKGSALITTPIFTRILSKEDIGSFSNLNSWCGILIVIVTLNVTSSVYLARFDYRDKLNDYISSALVLSSMSTLLFYIVCLGFKDAVLQLLAIDEYAFHILFLYLAVQPALEMFQTKNRILGKYKTTISLSLLSCILSTGIAIILVWGLNYGLLGRITGYYVPLICLNIVIYVYIIIKGRKLRPKYWKYALGFSLPLIMHDLAHNLLSSSDRIMITQLCGASDNAMYSIAYSCASIVSLLWSSMNNAWSPWAYECMDACRTDELKRAIKPYTVFFIAVVVMMMLIIPEMLFVMGGTSYMDAVSMIPAIMVGYIFIFVYSLYVNIEFFHKKQMRIAIGTVLAAFANIVLNYIFLKKFGYKVAAYTTLIGYILLFIYHFVSVHLLLKKQWYDTKFFIMVLTISLALIPVMQLLYKNTYVRYSIILVIACLFVTACCKKRCELISAIKRRSINDVAQILTDVFRFRVKKDNWFKHQDDL